MCKVALLRPAGTLECERVPSPRRVRAGRAVKCCAVLMVRVTLVGLSQMGNDIHGRGRLTVSLQSRKQEQKRKRHLCFHCCNKHTIVWLKHAATNAAILEHTWLLLCTNISTDCNTGEVDGYHKVSGM